jgi:hypothetical protein
MPDSLTVQQLKDFLHYDPATGHFTWIKSAGKRSYVGLKAGCVNTIGYWQIGFAGKRRSGHRLAWLYMTGEWPAQEIDHINLNRSDNSWANLRQANRVSNSGNAPCHKDNKTGVKGVSWNEERRKWVAQICIGGRQTNLGRYDSVKEAHAAYCEAAAVQFGEFARFG